MREYASNLRVRCPKCGVVNDHTLIVKYRKSDHGYNCPIKYEHLHGWCTNCQYDGIEYIFTVKKKE
jgi:hypothetical protein